jgi:hypothetical protein
MGGAGNSGQEPGSQTAVTGGGNAPIPGWGVGGALGMGGVPGGDTGGSGGVPGADGGIVRSPYEDIAASTGSGLNTGLLAGSPMGKSDTSLLTYTGPAPPTYTGFNQSTPYPGADPARTGAPAGTSNTPVITAAAPPPPPPPAPAPAPPPAPTDPWAGRVQIYGSGAEGFGTDTVDQYLARWPSNAQAQQKPGTDNWYLPAGVTR